MSNTYTVFHKTFSFPSLDGMKTVKKDDYNVFYIDYPINDDCTVKFESDKDKSGVYIKCIHPCFQHLSNSVYLKFMIYQDNYLINVCTSPWSKNVVVSDYGFANVGKNINLFNNNKNSVQIYVLAQKISSNDLLTLQKIFQIKEQVVQSVGG